MPAEGFFIVVRQGGEVRGGDPIAPLPGGAG
jgi:hypothetical protein